MIDKNIPLTTGMVIRNDVFTNRLFEIIKLGRKYATVTRYQGLPQIDRSNKVLFTQIYTDYSIRKERAPPPPGGMRTQQRAKRYINRICNRDKINN